MYFSFTPKRPPKQNLNLPWAGNYLANICILWDTISNLEMI